MTITCNLCFHHCQLAENETGFCRARANQGGQMISLNYGRLTALALDPIEKKPLRQFYPGSMILSVGSFGCNLRCPFCQNASIAQVGTDATTRAVSPEELVHLASELTERGNIGIAYTYNEPLIGYEYVRDCAALVHTAGLKNVLVTNGTIETPPWLALLPFIDAMNIDLKGFTDTWYHKLGGDLATVKKNIALAVKYCHVEVTTLIIPGENDGEKEIAHLAAWLASIDTSIPLHISRFFPRYHMSDRTPTNVDTVYRLVDIARKHLRYVYTGNC